MISNNFFYEIMLLYKCFLRSDYVPNAALGLTVVLVSKLHKQTFSFPWCLKDLQLAIFYCELSQNILEKFKCESVSIFM